MTKTKMEKELRKFWKDCSKFKFDEVKKEGVITKNFVELAFKTGYVRGIDNVKN